MLASSNSHLDLYNDDNILSLTDALCWSFLSETKRSLAIMEETRGRICQTDHIVLSTLKPYMYTRQNSDVEENIWLLFAEIDSSQI